MKNLYFRILAVWWCITKKDFYLVVPKLKIRHDFLKLNPGDKAINLKSSEVKKGAEK